MHIEYFHVPPQKVSANEIVVDEEEFAHLTHVMRKGVGDSIRIVDGMGTAYDTRIARIEQRRAYCTIESTMKGLNESPVQVTLGAALLKNPSRFYYLIEKTTELGVHRIIPVLTDRTIPRTGRIERYRKLAIGAMKQSCRCVLPEITDPVPFNDFLLQSSESSLRIIPHEGVSGPRIRDLPGGRSEVCIVVGPEGGFTEEEVERATRSGFSPVTLGPRRLRTETATVVAVSEVLL